MPGAQRSVEADRGVARENLADGSAGSHEGYSQEELGLTLFYWDGFGFRSMEDFMRTPIASPTEIFLERAKS